MQHPAAELNQRVDVNCYRRPLVSGSGAPTAIGPTRPRRGPGGVSVDHQGRLRAPDFSGTLSRANNLELNVQGQEPFHRLRRCSSQILRNLLHQMKERRGSPWVLSFGSGETLGVHDHWVICTVISPHKTAFLHPPSAPPLHRIVGLVRRRPWA